MAAGGAGADLCSGGGRPSSSLFGLGAVDAWPKVADCLADHMDGNGMVANRWLHPSIHRHDDQCTHGSSAATVVVCLSLSLISLHTIFFFLLITQSIVSESESGYQTTLYTALQMLVNVER